MANVQNLGADASADPTPVPPRNDREKLAELKRTSFKALQWDFIGKFGCQLVNLLVTTLLARLLSPEHFGLVAIAGAIGVVAAVVSEAGMYSALIQGERITHVHYNSAFYCSLVLSTGLCLIVCAFSGVLARLYDAPELKGVVIATGVLFILNALSSIQTAYLTKHLHFGPISKARILSAIVSGVVAVYLAYHGYGVWALVWQMILQTLVFTVAILPVCEWKVSRQFSFQALHELWDFGSKMFLSGVIDTLYRRLDVFIIGKAFSTFQLGYFQRARVLENLISEYGAGSLARVLFPAFSTIQNDQALLAHSFRKVYLPLAWLIFAVSGVAFVSAEEVVKILFSAKWLPCVEYLRLLLLGTFVYPLSAPLGAVVQATGNSTAFLKAEVYKKSVFTVNLAMLLVFDIRSYLIGLAIAGIIAYLINLQFASRAMGVRMSQILASIVPLLMIAVVATAVVYLGMQYVPWTNIWARAVLESLACFGSYTVLTALCRLEGYREGKKAFLKVFGQIKQRFS